MAKNTRPDRPDIVGQRLRTIRTAYGILQGRGKGLSQSAFARLIGVGAPALNNAETGDNRIGLDKAISICQATGVTLDYIYQGKIDAVPYLLAVEIEKIEKSKGGEAL